MGDRSGVAGSDCGYRGRDPARSAYEPGSRELRTLYNGRLYVPIASWEESAGRMPDYECCRFRGAVVALDALNGKEIWRADTIADPAKPFRKNSAGTQMYNPAGAAVWMAPTIDAKRRAIYIGTGNSYTDAPADSANAIVALNLDTGRTLWVKQMTSGDNYLAGCRRAGEGSCPSPMGPDVDFGSSPILRSLPNGRDILLCGQKSGVLWALDPIVEDAGAKGDLQLGQGHCNAAQSAAVSAMPGVVFSGELDGRYIKNPEGCPCQSASQTS